MQGKKPTREQSKILSRNNLDYKEWLVQKDRLTTMQIVHKTTKEEREISKEV